MCELRCPWGPEENIKPLGAGVQANVSCLASWVPGMERGSSARA